MRRFFPLLLLLAFENDTHAQTSFTADFKTYNIATIIKEYRYNYQISDAISTSFIDSTVTWVGPDSLVTLSIDYPSDHRTINYLNKKKQVLKTEYMRGETLMNYKVWRYDSFNRITYYEVKQIAAPGQSYIKTFHFDNKKTAEGSSETEYSYFNGKQEFATTSYFDKKNVKQKEVRVNGGGLTIHIETYRYDTHGRLRERSIYFPEYRTTKNFAESVGPDPKCMKQFLLPKEIVTEANREKIITRELTKYKKPLLDKDCDNLEYKVSNTACEITISKEKESNKIVIFKTLERKPLPPATLVKTKTTTLPAKKPLPPLAVKKK